MSGAGRRLIVGLAGIDGMATWLRATRPENLPHLSDEAISRDSIYEDRGLL